MNTYGLYDERNRKVEHFAGPHRLAKWDTLPAGWGIEMFWGDVSLGMVSLEDVRSHAEQERMWPHL